MEKIECSSPNQKHKAILKYLEEIRFGPAYYSLLINGQEIKDRIFGNKILFSEDSAYLATEEWLTTDYNEGPITRVSLFELSSDRISEFKAIKKGFAGDFKFAGNIFVYKEHYLAEGSVNEIAIDINKISNWKPTLKMSN